MCFLFLFRWTQRDIGNRTGQARNSRSDRSSDEGSGSSVSESSSRSPKTGSSGPAKVPGCFCLKSTLVSLYKSLEKESCIKRSLEFFPLPSHLPYLLYPKFSVRCLNRGKLQSLRDVGGSVLWRRCGESGEMVSNHSLISGAYATKTHPLFEVVFK